MKLIWNELYADSWGRLSDPESLSKSTKVPRHTGRAMDATPFDFKIVFVDDPTDCTKQVP